MRLKYALAAATITSLTLISQSTAATASPAESEIGINITDEDGERIWYGEESPEVAEIGNQADAIWNAHEDNIVGTALTSDRQVVEVYLKDLNGSGGPELQALQEKAGERLRLIPGRKLSRFTTEHAMDLVKEHELQIPELTSVSVDILTDKLEIGVDVNGPEGTMFRSAPTDEHSALGELAALLAEENVPVTYREEEPAESAAYHRRNDVSAFNAGGLIKKDGALCSLGVPIEIHGRFYGMTAGHCGKGTWRNGDSSRRVGATYTTTWVGTQHRLGDWQLLQGEHYALRVFSGAAWNDSRTLRISGGNFGGMRIGSSLCTSGATTGQVCRYQVQRIYKSTNVDGHEVYPTAALKHDSNLDGVGDCSGFADGDSGGMVYYSDGKGGVTAFGIVTSNMLSNGCTNAKYTVTQLAGLRMWNPAANVG